MIAALLYTDAAVADAALRGLRDAALAAGLRLAGAVQRDDPRPGRAACDMILEELSTGVEVPISEDRGPQARGCRLDADGLARAIALTLAALERGADLLLLNKFGKAEAEGRGFRPAIAAALERGVPVALCVPARNLEAWRSFAGDEAMETAAATCTPGALLRALRGVPASAS